MKLIILYGLQITLEISNDPWKENDSLPLLGVRNTAVCLYADRNDVLEKELIQSIVGRVFWEGQMV